MSRNSTALFMGELVFQTASRNGGDREKAALEVITQVFPTLGTRNRTFLLWALLNAESLYVRSERPALPAENQGFHDTQKLDVPAGNLNSDDGEGGGHTLPDTRVSDAPLSRRSIALDRTGPADYPIYVPYPVNQRKRLGDLTKTDIGYLYGDARKRRRHQEEKERGWKRLYEAVAENTTLEHQIEKLSSSDRRFLAEELGIEEWKKQAA